MGLPEGGNAPESLNDHEWFMQTRDNLALSGTSQEMWLQSMKRV